MSSTHPRLILAAALVVPLLAGACSSPGGSPKPAAATQAASPAPGVVNVTGAYRHGRYARGAEDLTVCVADALHQAHPELHFDLNVSQPERLTASRQGTGIWVVEFHEAGAGTSEVLLRDRGAAQAELEEIWRAVDRCGTQGS